MTYFQYIQQLEQAKGSNAKKEILKVALQNPTFSAYAKNIYNPEFIPNVRKVNPDIQGNPLEIAIVFPDLLMFLMENQSRTGEAVDIVERIISRAHPDEIPYLYRFLKRDMRCGVNRGLIEKIDPDLIPIFPIGLAAPWNKKHLKLPAWAEPKLDGIRCTSFIKNGDVTCFSRNGKTLELIDEFLDDYLYIAGGEDYVFDGELMGTDFQHVMTQAKRKKEKDQSKMIHFIFDGMPLADWMNQKSQKYTHRKSILNSLFDHADAPKLELVKGRYVKTEEEVQEFFEECVAAGFEGIIIKQDTPYVFKRSRDWLKLKPTETYDCIIVDVVAGKDDKKFSDTLGALWVELNGVKTQVGSGYSDQLRDEIWKDPNAYIGKMVEVTGEKELTNDGCIRFPRFKQFRPDKD